VAEGPLDWEAREAERERAAVQGPEAGQGPPPPARIGSRYSAIVGVIFLIVLVVAGVNSLNNREGSLLGAGADEAGMALAQFAVPDARGPVEGDANVAQDDCETSENPCPPERRRTPACLVKGEGVIRICDLFGRPLVLSFWFTRGGDCEAQQDIVDQVAARYRGRLNFLSLNIRDERRTVSRLIAERGWTLPVGHDADGAVSNLYRVGVCPTFVFAYPGGITMSASVGELGAAELEGRVTRLLRASRRRAGKDR
jgi:thiol-disulfide isomerase/thioredoxin